MSALREIRKARGLTQKQAAELIDATEMSVSRYERNDGRLTLPLMRRFAEAYDCTIAEIAGERPPLDGVDENQFVSLPVYSMRTPAKPGAVFSEDNVRYRFACSGEWLRSGTTAPLHKLAILEADGDGMAPTICLGDQILVDRSQTEPFRDGIYVLVWGGWISLKRVSTDPARKTIRVSSDNPKYAPCEPAYPGDAQVLGRVIWIGKRV